MVTILRNEDDSGKQLGQAFGNALGTGLGALASHKIDKLQNKHLEQKLIKDGFQPPMAKFLVDIGPKARNKYFEEQFDYHKFENQPINQQQYQQQSPMDQGQNTQQDVQQRMQQLSSQGMQQRQQQQSPLDQGRSQLQGNQQDLAELMQQLSGQGRPQQAPQQQFAAPVPQPQEQQGFSLPRESDQSQIKNDLLREQNLFNREQKLNEFQEKKQLSIDKKYSKLTEQFEKDYTVGSQLQILAEEMAALNEEIGEDWNPVKEGLVQGVHGLSKGFIDLRSGAGKAAEQFRNKANQYIDLSSNAIKGLPSKYRVQIKEAAKPSLTQSYEARKESVADAIKHAQVLQVPFQEEQRVLEENDGRLPEDFSRRVLPSIQQRQEEILRGDKHLKDDETFQGSSQAELIKEAKRLGLQEFDIVNDATGKTETFTFDKNGKLKRI